MKSTKTFTMLAAAAAVALAALPRGVDNVRDGLSGTGGLDFRSEITFGLWSVVMGGETATILFNPSGHYLLYQ